MITRRRRAAATATATAPAEREAAEEPEAAQGTGYCSIKCSLGRLRPAPEVRAAIERIAVRLQTLAVRATHVANEAALMALLRGEEPPDASDQTFWYRAICVSAKPSAGCACPHLTAAAEKLFGAADEVSTSRSWPFIASLALQMKTASVNMMKATFHSQLSKALLRILRLWESRMTRNGLSLLAADAPDKERKKLRSDVLRYAERRATQHKKIPLEWPQAAPASLKEAFDDQLDAWKRAFSVALPCPTPSFVRGRSKTQPGNYAVFLRWSFALQQQRVATKRALAIEAGTTEAEAIRSLAGLARGLYGCFLSGPRTCTQFASTRLASKYSCRKCAPTRKLLQVGSESTERETKTARLLLRASGTSFRERNACSPKGPAIGCIPSSAPTGSPRRSSVHGPSRPGARRGRGTMRLSRLRPSTSGARNPEKASASWRSTRVGVIW